jgi:acetoacetyl-CoA synthetase
MKSPTWIPDPDSGVMLRKFHDNMKIKFHLEGLQDLHNWSVNNSDQFWAEVWDFFEIIGEKGDETHPLGELPKAVFFPKANLSLPANLLSGGGNVYSIKELDIKNKGEKFAHEDIVKMTASLSNTFREHGLGESDCVVAVLPVGIEVLVTTLAGFNVGATVATASPEFGADAILARFAQLEPKVLVYSNTYSWQGKEINRSLMVEQVARGLPTLKLIIGLSENKGLVETVLWSDAISSDNELVFTKRSFDHPAYVLFTSGTTGAPKGLLHRSGGVLLKHLVEMKLHCDIRAGDRVSFYTTTGWMMWNWELSILATGADLILFDGAPTFPDSLRLFHFAKAQKLTHLGVSARLLDLIREKNPDLKKLGTMPDLRVIMVTGSPLSKRTAQWISDQFDGKIFIAPFSGGTDLVGSFMGPNPLLPYFAGEMQGPLLGMNIDCWDEEGNSCEVGEIGELVCKSAFPTVPLGIWGDQNDVRLKETYFHRWENIWIHGDLVSKTAEGGYIVHGRSDATLNVSGVRIGTGEIYAALDSFHEISGALAFTQPWDGDQRIVLLITVKNILDFDAYKEKVREEIRIKCSPRHMPAEVFFVSDLPRTFNGKLAEVAVTDLAYNRTIRNFTSLANPEVLTEIRKAIF